MRTDLPDCMRPDSLRRAEHGRFCWGCQQWTPAMRSMRLRFPGVGSQLLAITMEFFFSGG
jgi:hypothetical protein